jgi:hypothetical protein
MVANVLLALASSRALARAIRGHFCRAVETRKPRER